MGLIIGCYTNFKESGGNIDVFPPEPEYENIDYIKNFTGNGYGNPSRIGINFNDPWFVFEMQIRFRDTAGSNFFGKPNDWLGGVSYDTDDAFRVFQHSGSVAIDMPERADMMSPTYDKITVKILCYPQVDKQYKIYNEQGELIAEYSGPVSGRIWNDVYFFVDHDKAELYSAKYTKIETNGDEFLVYDLKPVRRTIDNELGLLNTLDNRFFNSINGGIFGPEPEPEKRYYTITTQELENSIQFSDLHIEPGTYIWEQIEEEWLRNYEWVRFRFVPEKRTSIIGLDNLRNWRYFMICEGDDIFKIDYSDANGEYRADDYLFEAGHVYNILIQKSDQQPWTGTITAEYPEDIQVTDRQRVNAIYIGSGLRIDGSKTGLTSARENTSLQMDCVVKNGGAIFFGAFDDKYYNGAFAIRNEGDKIFVGLNNVANYHDFGEAIPMEIPVSVKLSQEEGIMEVRNLRHSDQIRYYNFTQNANWTRANLSQTIQLFGFNVGGISSETTQYNSLICGTIKLKGWEGSNEQRDIYPCRFTMSNGTEKYGFYNEWSGWDYILRGARDASGDWSQYMDSTNDFSKFIANIESDGRMVFTANDYKGDYIGEIPFIYRKDGNYYRVNIYPDYNEETKQYQNTGTRKTVEELNPNTIDINHYFVLSYNDENTLWLDDWPDKWFDAFYGVPPLSWENFEPIRNNQEWAFREVSAEPNTTNEVN